MSEELLTFEELKILISSPAINKIATILKEKLRKKCFMREFGNGINKLYVAQPEHYYKQYTGEKIDEKIKCIFVLLIENSMEDLGKSQMQKLKDDYPKTYKLIYKNAFIQGMLPQLRDILTEDERSDFIQSLDKSQWQLHFLNGYVDMRTGRLLKRYIEKTPVTYVIDRNYTKPRNDPKRKKDVKLIMEVFAKIFPVEDDLTIFLLIIAGALTGDSTKDQLSLFWGGEGSNGKSILTTIIQICFGDYIQALGPETFVKGNPKQEKMLNQFLINLYIRLAWINEMSDKAIDESVFKNFCDGVIRTSLNIFPSLGSSSYFVR
jgi:phage/plasmid-associated DNA primase